MKRVVSLVAAAVLVFVGVVVVRAVRVPSPPPAAPETPAPFPLDPKAAGDRLAGAVRFATVSYASGAPIDTAAFLGLHDYLAATFPRTQETLRREAVAGLSLLYTWPGTDTTLPPVVLMGHMDVVPVPEASRGSWTQAPFEGTVADGFVWGRGTLDDKVTVLSILEAVEGLIATGYRPPRTVYLSFGHDEEVGGRFGARAIVSLLLSRGVKPALVLDEGGFMASGVIPGLPGRAAIVGVAEKGYLSLKVTARAAGGHSSMPTGRTAVGALSRAIAALEASPFPSSFDGLNRSTFESMAPYAPFAQKLVLANLWLTRPLVTRKMQGSPLGAALLHTTTSPTMLAAGIKDNVLPPEATAVVNFRIKPGETMETVMTRVRSVIGDTLVDVAPLDSARVDPSPISDVRSPAYQLIAETIRGMAPGQPLPVLPYLVMGGTDAKYWGEHSDRTFRFLAVPLGDGDLARFHGVDERIAVSDYGTAITFFARLLKGLDRL